ncbi:MAG TPA: hypothetical protein DD671_13395, partial [Balneolaceae bacterium]|nr:hypothetical protein [Balneolaceae bacterium]
IGQRGPLASLMIIDTNEERKVNVLAGATNKIANFKIRYHSIQRVSPVQYQYIKSLLRLVKLFF